MSAMSHATLGGCRGRGASWAAGLAAAWLALAPAAPALERELFEADLRALCATPHRLAGRPDGSLRAAAHVARELARAGVSQVVTQDFPVVMARHTRCEMEIDGRRVPLLAARPNSLQASVTPPEGIAGDTVYAGDGAPERYPGRDMRGRIAVLDAGAGTSWLNAFAFGARAVIFVLDDATDPLLLHVNVPADLPRFALPRRQAETLGLLAGPRRVTLRAEATWEKLRGRNVIGIIRGGAPAEAGEPRRTLLLAAPLDSYSELPELAPGARDAANVAVLLALAREFARTPPPCDIVLAFFDGQAQNHMGARHFYGALCRRLGLHKTANLSNEARLAQATAEAAFVRHVRAVLQQPRLFDHATAAMPEHGAALRLLMREATRLGAETSATLSPLRLRAARLAADDAAAAQGRPRTETEPTAPRRQELRDEIARLEMDDLAWNSVLRLLARRIESDDRARLRKIAAKLVESVSRQSQDAEALAARIEECSRTVRDAAFDYCDRRADELETGLEEARCALRLQHAIGPERNTLSLHLSLNLGDAGERWSLMHGDDTLPTLGQEGEDEEGVYSGIYKAARQAADAVTTLRHFDRRPISDVYSSRMFAPGSFIDSGAVARIFSRWNLALMTVHDRLPRQGQSDDTVARLNLDRLLAQAAELPAFLRAMAVQDELARANPHRPRAYYLEAVWSRNQRSGMRVRQGDIGDPMRAADVGGAVVAVFPAGGAPWSRATPDAAPPGSTWEIRALSDAGGIVELPPLPRMIPLWETFALGPRPTPDAPISVNAKAATKGELGLPQNLLLCRSRALTAVGYDFDYTVLPTPMNAASTTAFAADRHQLCVNGEVLVLFAPHDATGVKLFSPGGLVALNNRPTRAAHQGFGFALPQREPLVPTLVTASDLTALNAYRLDLLRNNKIGAESLDILNGCAADLRQQADELAGADAARYHGALAASAGFARRAYQPAVSVMKDLVTAVVIILLLTVPFAFALERLLIGEPRIYRRLGWFAGFFLATFTILFMVNPAFKLAATPLIIFLAFAVIVLSAMVIFIMLRKLETELKRSRGVSATAHSMDVSRMSTMAAAVAMGISTMRRRPLRTVLTAVTVILLTFTILTFASFSNAWGLRQSQVGTLREPPAHVVLRHAVWENLRPALLDVLRGFAGARAAVHGRYWIAPTVAQTRAAIVRGALLDYPAARPDTEALVPIAAAVGLDAGEVALLPRLRECFAADARLDLLATNGLFLTRAAGEGLGLTARDAGRADLFFNGHPMVFAGFLDERFAAATLIDGSSLLPVDYRASLAMNSESSLAQMAAETAMESATFLPFAADRVAVLGAAAARRMGGALRAISIYPEREQDALPLARDAAVISALPTYCGSEGIVRRFMFASLFTASGVKALLIPIFLGGLIIFATMLGSVADREREIYAFSALGLAPPHVAMLFFAEASVYAVVGGMGGYLLGQAVATGLSFLATQGLVDVPSMNFSSMNAVLTILVVMAIVMLSTLYPAIKASRSANPGIKRAWRLPPAGGDLLDVSFPFTVSEFDLAGVVAYLEEHFGNFSDTAMGDFATLECHAFAQTEDDQLGFAARVALAPFDLGIEQRLVLLSRPSEVQGVNEVRLVIRRQAGANGDWYRANRVFLREIRKQFLLWRTLDDAVAQQYRNRVLERWDELPRHSRHELLTTLGVPE